MKDVNEFSSEVNIEVDKLDDNAQSVHSFNRSVLYIKPIKDANNNYIK